MQEKIQDHLTSLKIKKKHNKILRGPENIWKLVLILAERIKKERRTLKIALEYKRKENIF